MNTRFRGFSGPVGSGKTMALAENAVLLAHANEGRVGLLGAPTYPMLRDATLKALVGRLEAHGLRQNVDWELNVGEMRMTIRKPRSTILLRPVENFDRLRGQNLAWFGLDELTYCPEYAWLQLEARLRDPLAPDRVGFAVWTPKGHDWVYRRFIGPDRESNYSVVLAKPHENTYLPADYYANLTKSYDPLFARQEVLGEYLNVFSGRAYQQFDRKLNVYPLKDPEIIEKAHKSVRQFQSCHFDPARPLLWALDFNISPASSVIAQSRVRKLNFAYERLTNSANATQLSVSDVSGTAEQMQLNILDEIYLTDSNTYKVCEEFLLRCERIRDKLDIGKLFVICYGDPSGNSRQSSAARTDWQIIRDFFDRHNDIFNVSFRVRSDHPAVKDRVNAVNWMLCSATGVRRMLVHERCKETIRDLEEVAWKRTVAGVIRQELDQDKDPMRTHITDALGYLVHAEWGLRAHSGPRSGVIV